MGYSLRCIVIIDELEDMTGVSVFTGFLYKPVYVPPSLGHYEIEWLAGKM